MDTPSSRSPSPLTISSWDFSPWSSPPSSASSPPGSPPFFFSQFKHESDLENDPEQGSSTDSALTEEPYQQEPDLVLEEIDEEIDEQGAEEQGGQVEDDDLYEEALRDPTPVPIIIDVQEPPRTPTPPPPPTPPPRHPEFYFSDGTVIFKVSHPVPSGMSRARATDHNASSARISSSTYINTSSPANHHYSTTCSSSHIGKGP